MTLQDLANTQKELYELSFRKLSLAQEEEHPHSGDENRQPDTRQTDRSPWAGKAQAATDGEDFNVPRREVRLHKKSAALPEETQDTPPGQRSVLGESNPSATQE